MSMVKCDLSSNELVSTKSCTACCKEYSIDQFIGMKNNITKTCKKCRDNNKIQDAKRNKEHRNEVARKNSKKPENKAVKAKWNEENYDKVAKKTMDYRQRKIEKLGTEEYLKQQAEQAMKWREKNPEKMEEANEYKKNSKKINYGVYKRTANYKNLEFTITYDDYVNIVDKDCHYCGTIQEKGFNGIDRKDQTMGYLLDNCVSCCKMCNYIKGSCSDEVFIKRIEHILTFQNKISGNLYPQCFANHNSSSYSVYKSRAIKKQIDFLITISDYKNIVNNECYLCGKKSDETHINGIDRYDNNKGYILDNTKTCCCECNYMKKDYIFDDIINKFMLIYEKNKNTYIDNDVIVYEDNNELPNQLTNSIVYTNNAIPVIASSNNDDKKDKNRNKQQTHRERIIQEHGIEYVRNKQREKMRRLRDDNKNIVKNHNKKTDEEIREAARIRKQKQREILREKYGDEEYKEMRAKEIADNRKKKNTKEDD